jgi:hypothetical protein
MEKFNFFKEFMQTLLQVKAYIQFKFFKKKKIVNNRIRETTFHFLFKIGIDRK